MSHCQVVESNGRRIAEEERRAAREREGEEEGCRCGERCVVLESIQSVMMKLVRERWRGRPRLVGETAMVMEVMD